MDLFLDGVGTLQSQLSRALRQHVSSGGQAPGSALPGSRSLATELGLSRTTVLLAIDQLIAEGYLESRPRVGTFVRAAPSSPPPQNDSPASGRPLRLSSAGRRMVREFSKVLVGQGSVSSETSPRLDFRYSLGRAEDFPLAAWRRALGAAARKIEARSFRYPPLQGSPALREALTAYLERSRGLRVSADRLWILSGSQQGLDLATQLLIDPGDVAAIENPHYPAARLALRARGARVIAIPVDGEGLDPKSLRARPESVRFVHVTPSHQFPLGGVMPLGRRLDLIDWARQTNAILLEDDYNGEFRLDGRPLEPLISLDPDGRVLYIGTFSKTLLPSLRLGFMIVPPGLHQGLRAAKLIADQGRASLEQEALALFIEEGSFERHVRRVRRRQRQRRAGLLDEVGAQLGDRVRVHGKAGGLHVVLELRGVDPLAIPAIVKRAAENGVGVYDLAPYFKGRACFAGLLLGTASLDGAEIKAGVRGLSNAW